MAEKIAEEFETAMKKGFISALILLVLEKSPSYGYKIGKEIETRTLGIWEPPSSTMYTVLKNMLDKGLIQFIEEQKGGRTRKVYQITPKGEAVLNMMLEKQRIIDDSIKTLRTAMLDNEESIVSEKFQKFNPINLMLAKINEKTNDEKLQFLELQKLRISREIKRLSNQKQRIEEIITELNKI
jgi:DNA-binding PadR family transcriptional regulator